MLAPMVLHEPYELRRVATDSLRPNPNRHLLPALTDRELERLRASIAALGIITPSTSCRPTTVT